MKDMEKMNLEKAVLSTLQQSLNESIEKTLTGYGSPLTKFVAEVVNEHETDLKAIMRESLSSVIATKNFKESVKDAFLHKVARTLVDQMYGSVKQAAEKLRQDPTIKAQMVLAIQKIIDGTV